MHQKLNIALLQSDIIWENDTENLVSFSEKIDLLSQNIDLIILPEMFTTGFSMQPLELAEKMDGTSVTWMLEKANEKQMAIIGSLIIQENGDYYNRLVFAHPDGTIDYYDKRHLFSYGGEGKLYTAGTEKQIINYKGWRICPLICYDLRFPIWSRNTQDYDILIYVANWPKARINAWDTLLKARAIENMCYTIGVNRVGYDGNNLEYNGHSQAIDMLGNELVTSQTETNETIECTLDKTKLEETRKRFGFLNDGDLFNITKKKTT